MSSLDPMQRQTLALAGVFQAAKLVHEVAQRGIYDHQPFATSIESILVTDPQTFEEIYGGDLQNLKSGAEVMRKALTRSAELHPSVLKYAMSILVLQVKLGKRPDMMTALGERLDAIKQQAMHFSATHENVLAALAGLYQDTLSTFSYRVQVTGDPQVLQQANNADKIRSLLLAGVRSAMLWQQAGGKRWKLLFARKRLLNDLQALHL